MLRVGGRGQRGGGWCNGAGWGTWLGPKYVCVPADRPARYHSALPCPFPAPLHPGCLANPAAFRERVQLGGVEPEARPEAWKHLLGVHPPGVGFAERGTAALERRRRYQALRAQVWGELVCGRELIQAGRGALAGSGHAVCNFCCCPPCRSPLPSCSGAALTAIKPRGAASGGSGAPVSTRTYGAPVG